jgi:hypothetical protein
MSDNVKRIQKLARQLAHSGNFIGWRPIAFELRFEPGYKQAFEWIHSEATQDELDRLCFAARKPRRSDPEAA